MGNKLASQVERSDFYLHDLNGIVFEDIVGNGRFMKTLRCVHDEGKVVVKVYLKRQPQTDLVEHIRTLTELKENLNLIRNRNVFPFQSFYETDKAAYLIRQHFCHNLLDRLGTRPFLSLIEKKWIAFQLLMALKQAHWKGICHGDLKCENVMVTSWRWVYLTDFATYKPTYIPEDDPADFYFFFDSSASGTCCIAPERIVNLQTFDNEQTDPVPTMDIFSLGCVLAELFLEFPLFDFPSLLRYRSGENDPLEAVFRIPNQDVQHLILHMLNRDPTKRFSASKYLSEWETKGFPKSFLLLHGYISRLMMMSPDRIIRVIHTDRSHLVRYFAPSKASVDAQQSQSEPFVASKDQEKEGKENQKFYKDQTMDYAKAASELEAKLSQYSDSLTNKDPTSLLFDTEKLIRNAEADHNVRVARSVGDKRQPNAPSDSDHPSLPQIAALNKGGSGKKKEVKKSSPHEERNLSSLGIALRAGEASKYFTLDSEDDRLSQTANRKRESSLGMDKESPLMQSLEDRRMAIEAGVSNPSSTSPLGLWGLEGQMAIGDGVPEKDPGSEPQSLLVILLGLVCSHIRSISSPFLRRTALDIFGYFAPYVDDECRLQQLLPYTTTLLSDSDPLVRVAALRTLTTIVGLVKSFPSPTEADVFPECLLPTLSRLAFDKDELVRREFAINLARLAEVARSFLEKSQFFKQSELLDNQHDLSEIHQQQSYDSELLSLQKLFLDIVTGMLSTETSSAVKQALLKDITQLCIFFGRATTNDFLLPLVITFLNDLDWRLKSCFFQHISGVALFVGTKSLESFILPCVYQGLFDEEEFVVEKALTCLASLCQLSLFRKHILLEIIDKIKPMLFHPSVWVRSGCMSVVVVAASRLDSVDQQCFLVRSIRPFMAYECTNLNQETILNCIKPPLSRTLFTKGLLVAQTCVLELSQGSSSVSPSSSSEKEDESDEKAADLLLIDDFTDLVGELESSKHMKQGEADSLPDADGSLAPHGTAPSLGVPSGDGGKNSGGLKESRGNVFAKRFMTKSFYELFVRNIEKTKATKEELLQLREMSGYLRSLSQVLSSRRRYPFVPLENDGRRTETRHDMLEYASISATKPVHEITIAPTSVPYPVEQLLISAAQTDTFRADRPTTTQSKKDRTLTVSPTLSPPTSPVGSPELSSYGRSAPKAGSRSGPVSLMAQPIAANKKRMVAASASLPTVFVKGITEGSPNPSSPQHQTSDQFLDQSISREAWDQYFGHVSRHQNVPFHRPLRCIPPAPAPDLGTISLPRQQENKANWRPRGLLVMDLLEHKEAVNRIVVSPDQTFFATCSDDGTVKIWDGQRLERNITNRSRRTYRANGRISCLSMCQNSQSIIAGSSNGDIHVFRVDAGPGPSGTSGTTIQGLTPVFISRDHTSPIVEVAHYNHTSSALHCYQSVVVSATSNGLLSAWDLRSQKEAWHTQVPYRMGPTSSFLVERNHNWMVISTSRGNYTCHDARFNVPVKSWAHPAASPHNRINRLFRNSVPKGASRPWFMSAVGCNELWVWDIETLNTKHLFRMLPGTHTPLPSLRGTPINDSKLDKGKFFDDTKLHLQEQTTEQFHSVRAVHSPSRNSLITGGTDKMVRYWDLEDPSTSFVVCGLEEGAPRRSYASDTHDTATVYQELPTSDCDASLSKFRSFMDSPHRGSASVPHLDAILDINTIQTNDGSNLLLTCCRGGVVKVWK